MGIFSGTKQAKMSGGSGVYFEPGAYLVEAVCNKTIKSRKGDNFFVAEFIILESTVADRPVGTSVTWMCAIDPDDAEKYPMQMGNIVQYAAALTGVSTDDVTEKDLEDLCASENPGAGLKVRANATTIMIGAKKNQPFTKVIFTHIAQD